MTSMTQETLQLHREDWKTLENYNIHTDQNMQDWLGAAYDDIYIGINFLLIYFTILPGGSTCLE